MYAHKEDLNAIRNNAVGLEKERKKEKGNKEGKKERKKERKKEEIER